MEEELVAALRRHGLVERTIVTSFLRGPLRAARRPRAGAPARALVPERPCAAWSSAGFRIRSCAPALVALRPLLPFDVVRLVRGSTARVASLHHQVVSDALVRRCRRHGIPVLAWTANDPGALGRLAALGVDGVITDDPRIFS